MLKLIFTCKSYAISITEKLHDCKVQLNSFFLVFYFDCLFEDWSVVCLLYFVLSLLDTLFNLFPEIIVRFIFWGIVNLSVMIQAKGWKSIWILSIICREFCDALTWLSIVSLSHFNKKSAVSDFLRVFKFWTSCWLICIV